MSRSRKKSPISGMTTAPSEKQDKRDYNRHLRRKVSAMDLQEAEVFPIVREVSNVWCMAKDGKYYPRKITKDIFRK